MSQRHKLNDIFAFSLCFRRKHENSKDVFSVIFSFVLKSNSVDEFFTWVWCRNNRSTWLFHPTSALLCLH